MPAAPAAVDADEAGGSERCQGGAGDGGPETPAEVRVASTRRQRRAVVAVREATERRHGRHLQDNCNNTIPYTDTSSYLAGV